MSVLFPPELPVVDRPPAGDVTIALVGNPNAGKTSLFNRLTGLRARTANFAGTTVEHHSGVMRLAQPGAPGHAHLLDLPGMYSLDAHTPDEEVARRVLIGELPGGPTPDVVLLVVDATNLERNLFLASQVLELGMPTVVALNLMDAAERDGLQIDTELLSQRLGAPVTPVSARTGAGLEALRQAVGALVASRVRGRPQSPAPCTACSGCQYGARFDWAQAVGHSVTTGRAIADTRRTDAVDRWLTHPLGGLAAFAAVMLAVFVVVFWLAQFPMGWIEGLVALAGDAVSGWLPPGDLRSLLVDGLVGGVGGVLVFLPQIALLFFLLALLEDTGYLARAALVMDRLMARVGLPGKAFVPMLSAHACAIPAILATRVIDDRRDRLTTILVLPLLTCSARVPVYALVVALLFAHQPVMAALTFAGAYALGVVAALSVAWALKRTLLRGEPRPLIIELPNFRRPSIRTALLQAVDRSWMFLANAGTVILCISLALWAAATYPKTPLERFPPSLRAEFDQLNADGQAEAAERLAQRVRLEGSLAGRVGALVQPVFDPLGFDWRMTVGVMSSFAAREVVVSTLSVLYGMGAQGEGAALTERLRDARDAAGRPVFHTANCLSLLVFYVLAMQCLPTQAVTWRETGSWKWAGLQLAYMSLLAYGAALATYQGVSALGL